MGELGRILRESRGTIPQRDVAASLGVSLTFVSDVERGNRYPSPDLLLRWCDERLIDAKEAFEAWFHDRFPEIEAAGWRITVEDMSP